MKKYELESPTIDMDEINENYKFMWYLLDDAYDIPQFFSFEMSKSYIEDLKEKKVCILCIMNTIVNKCVDWLLDNELETKDDKNKFRMDFHDQFIQDNKTMLNDFENMIKDYVEIS